MQKPAPSPAPPLPLEGKKVVLRDWEARDLPEFRRWNEGSPEWKNWDGPFYPHFGQDELEAKILKLQNLLTTGVWPDPRNRLVIGLREKEELLIGTVSCYWQSQASQWISAGLNIYDPSLRRQGLGFEALGMWTGYLFRSRPELVRLDLRTWSGNVGMMRLAEKLGFKLEARFRKARLVKGVFYDALGYGLLREEWEELNQMT